MHRNQNSVLRLSILASLTVVGFALSSAASAACLDPNTCFGTAALQNNTTGSQNTAIGYEALFSSTLGNDNTAVGYQALYSSVNSRWNTAVGIYALSANDSGGFNAAVGDYALWNNSSGVQNVAIGSRSLLRNFSGQENTAAGAYALESNYYGNYNTAVGASALRGNTTSLYNTAAGYYALAHESQGGNSAFGAEALRGFHDLPPHENQGSLNTAVGWSALANIYSGTLNTAIGHQALGGLTENDTAISITGNNNTANGAFALRKNSSGAGNTATGQAALRANTSGNRNTATGINALSSLSTGVRNTTLGAASGRNIETGSDNIVIGAENFGIAAENGAIRIGNSTYQKKTFIAGIRGVTTGLATATAVFIDANGQLGTKKSTREAKENIQPMGNVSERLLDLRPVTFRYIDAYDDGSKPIEFGLIAEEVAEAFPELVVYNAEGKPETVRYDLVATLLLNEFQKAHGVIETQATRIAALEAQSAELAQLKQEIAGMAETIDRLDHARMVATAP